MTRNDFIENYTEDYTESLADAQKQAKRCEYVSHGLTEWYLDGKYVDIKDMTADQLVKVSIDIRDMADDLAKLADLVSAMATAKNELESVDLYEFDEDNGAE